MKHSLFSILLMGAMLVGFVACEEKDVNPDDGDNTPVDTIPNDTIPNDTIDLGEAPTLYYAVQGGNIMALKLYDNLPEGVQNNPIDLGVSAGAHAFNLLFEDSTLFVLDAGEQFVYVDDYEERKLGDGKILAVAHDGSNVETVITNEGQYAFDDPFFGYIENGDLYYANRSTGIIKLRTSDRNKVYSEVEFPWYVQNSTTTYYTMGLFYGAIGAGFGKINGVWHWCKIYNGQGIFRFRDEDILAKPITQATGNPPEAGIALSNMRPKAFVYNSTTDEFFFTLIDEAGCNGLYRCATMADLNSISSQADLSKYAVLYTSGEPLYVDLTGTNEAVEGNATEAVGICQLALDERTGCVYFGYRSAPDSEVPAGLMRYNPQTGKVETVIEGVKIYGVTINQKATKGL